MNLSEPLVAQNVSEPLPPECEAAAFDRSEVPWLLPLSGSEALPPETEAAPWLLPETEAAHLPLSESEPMMLEYEAAPWLLPETEAARLPLSESLKYEAYGFPLSGSEPMEKAKRISDLREAFRRNREKANRTSEIRESFRRDREEAKRIR